MERWEIVFQASVEIKQELIRTKGDASHKALPYTQTMCLLFSPNQDTALFSLWRSRSLVLLKGDLEEEEEVYTECSIDWVQSSRPHSYRDSLGTLDMQMFGGSSSHEEEAKDEVLLL